MTSTILNILFFVFSGLLFFTLFSVALLMLDDAGDLFEQLTEEKIRDKERKRTRRLDIVSKAAASFMQASGNTD